MRLANWCAACYSAGIMLSAVLKAGPEWMRTRFTDNQRFLIMCMIAGLLCGLAAVAFHFAIHEIFHWLWEFAEKFDTWSFVGIMIAAPTLAGLIVGLAVRFFSPSAAGSGIPQTKEAYYNQGGKITFRAGISRFVLGSLYVGLGNSLGREGPTVHVSAAISSWIGRWAFKDPARVQSMLPVGMAAGIAAAFNAPLSALTFVFEELLDNFSMKAIGGMVIAVVIAAAISRTILGEDPVIITKLAADYQTSAWMLVAIPLGIAAGLLGHLFVSSVLNLRKWFKTERAVPGWLNPAIGGFGCGVIGITIFYLTGRLGDAQNSVFSIGYHSLEAAFENHLAISVLALLLIGKCIAVVLNYASGGSGGLFAPTLFLGGMLGGLVGLSFAELEHWIQWVPQFPADSQVVGGCVLLGMGAMFASVIRCPFTSLIIIFEMTGNYSLILPLMAGNIISWQIAKALQPTSVYTSLLMQDGVSLKRLPAYRGARDYRKLPVQSIMTHVVFTIAAEETPAEALKRITAENKKFHAYPVIASDGTLHGVITLHEIRENILAESVGDLIADQELLSIEPDCSIHRAANQMIAKDFQQVPVVANQQLIGWLTMNDIARQQNAMEA